MDQQTPTVQYHECRCCRRRGWSVLGSVLKLIGFVVVVVAAFAAGVLARSPMAMWDIVERPIHAGAVSVSGISAGSIGSVLSLRDDDSGRLFGVIRKVTGNTITIADNGGGLQLVLTSARTVILGASGEVALSALKVGQSVRIMGVAGEAGLAARSIEILR